MGVVPSDVEVGERNAELLQQPFQTVSVGQLERMLGSLDRVDDVNWTKLDLKPSKNGDFPLAPVEDENYILSRGQFCEFCFENW